MPCCGAVRCTDSELDSAAGLQAAPGVASGAIGSGAEASQACFLLHSCARFLGL
jgi:hypothetical protein